MKVERRIPSPAIKRLPAYLRCLTRLLQMGVERVTSQDLSDMMGTTSVQVRQDFFNFKFIGVQGSRYDVSLLHQEIIKILDLENPRYVIIIGAGSLGQALAKHAEFEKVGFKIIGIFDVAPPLIGEKIRNIEIMHLKDLYKFVRNNHVDIAAMTVPEATAYDVSALIVRMGIKGIWNFTSIELKVPPDIIVENIHLIDSLMLLGYKLSEARNATILEVQ